MAVQVKMISKKKLLCGEGPHWDERTQSLYFVDIPGCAINKYDSKTGLHTHAKLSDQVSVIIPVENEPNKFLVTIGTTVATVVWDGVGETVSDFKELQKLDEDEDMRTNDGKVGPDGVLFIGHNRWLRGKKANLQFQISADWPFCLSAIDMYTLSTMVRNLDFDNMEKRGNLHSLKNFKPKRLLGELMIANGLAWSHDEKTFYFIDSGKRKVQSYQYDKETTEITNEKTVFDFDENNIQGLPDGMTIDTDGNLWVACYDGSKVINVDPREGKLLKTVELPARFITSVAFGGPNFEDLYVTSATASGLNAHLSKADDGCTFVITGTGARGLPAPAIRL